MRARIVQAACQLKDHQDNKMLATADHVSILRNTKLLAPVAYIELCDTGEKVYINQRRLKGKWLITLRLG